MKHIKITTDKLITELLEDGIAVKLNAEKEVLNSEILRHSLVVKVLGDRVSFPLCSMELRKQWRKFGNFHMTSIGLNWILCSFKSLEAMDEVLSGGPWFVGGYIVGMDKWSPHFDPKSFKGISAPIWIRLPCLPLYCWDEENIIRIASRVGVPMILDGNSFKWGKREFARVCVCLNMENSLPHGIWVDKIAGRFFQKIEYEKIDSICYQCGKVGHDSKICPDIVRKKTAEQDGNRAEVGKNKEGMMESRGEDGDYGPWIHVKFKNRRIRNGNLTMAGRNGKNNAVSMLQTETGQISDKEILPRRGARKKEASLYLKEIVRDHEVSFVGLMETKLSSFNRSDADFFIGKDWDFFHYPANGLAGVYGSRSHNERSGLWNLLESCFKDSGPAIVGGDFNCILNKEEKKGGKRFLLSKGAREMREFLTNLDFHVASFVGPSFTWCNNKEGSSRIWERLDRCLLNSAVLHLVPFVKV
ncbi:uncharacterized protein LOC110115610 [Dendrobium catenatum]|uniref:uncharacterized protein LOC110115610 n=1 Tax=Dendrobium catenatum TaxID=906689 RepID=UPI0009F3E59A|nr:uncharacterized protein LOC110115610 [Dendrobium catenatum]